MPRKRRLAVKALSVAMGHFRTRALQKNGDAPSGGETVAVLSTARGVFPPINWHRTSLHEISHYAEVWTMLHGAMNVR
jgi:hypothetical protein